MHNQDSHSNSSERIELAALGAIAALDQTHGDLADAMASDPDFAADVAAFEAAAAALAYAAPPVPMAADLKQRLWARLEPAAETSAETSELLQLLSTSIADLKQQAAALKWKVVDAAPGFEIATWKIDRASRETALFVRADGEGRFPDHRHAIGEVILVLEGDIIVGEQTYGVGDRIPSAAGSIHGPATRTGCLLLCISSLDDRFV
jgi:hypothetical protein